MVSVVCPSNSFRVKTFPPARRNSTANVCRKLCGEQRQDSILAALPSPFDQLEQLRSPERLPSAYTAFAMERRRVRLAGLLLEVSPERLPGLDAEAEGPVLLPVPAHSTAQVLEVQITDAEATQFRGVG
jgi:hypothetical protein